MKLKGKGNYTNKEELYVYRNAISNLHNCQITLNHERAGDIIDAMIDISRAKRSSFNRAYVAPKEHKAYINKMFWKLARAVCLDSDFKGV